MTHRAEMSADQILAIPLAEPERLYSGDEDEARREHRALRSRWHPDTNPDAPGTIIAHVNALYDAAVEKLRAGTWREPGLLTVTDVRGRKYQARFLASRSFELGEVFIGEHIVAYKIGADHGDLVDRARRTIHNFEFANSEMRAEVFRYLPRWIDHLKLPDGHLVVLGKDPEMLCLADVVRKLGGRLDPRHAAWVMSRLHNLLCYFQWAGIVHNDVSPENYYVSAAQHSGCMVGGWWYAARIRERMIALPARTMALARPDVLSRKLASPVTDGDLARAAGREILGDPVGTNLGSDVPDPMAGWLRSPSRGDALEEYRTWQDKVLIKAFGPRRFVRMDPPRGLYD